jgi:hypothetical protein
MKSRACSMGRIFVLNVFVNVSELSIKECGRQTCHKLQGVIKDTPVHCGENSRIFRDAADQTLPVTEYSKIT